jgi:hypothetical protein
LAETSQKRPFLAMAFSCEEKGHWVLKQAIFPKNGLKKGHLDTLP